MMFNWNKNLNTVLSYYHNETAAKDALDKLQNHGIQRSLSIHNTHDGKIHIKSYTHSWSFYGIGFLVIAALISLAMYSVELELFIIPAVLFSTILCLHALFTSFFYGMSNHTINRYKKNIVGNEILIIAEVKDKDVTKALNILRSVESDHPISFVLRKTPSHDHPDPFFFKEPLPIDDLQKESILLAESQKEIAYTKLKNNSLLSHLKKCQNTLEDVRHHFLEAENIEQTIAPSGNWLLDNGHVIRETVEEITRNFTPSYSRDLPRIVSKGHVENTPRVYKVAKEFVELTANRINQDNMIAFLTSYQTVSPLTIGELWAFPLMVKLRLIEVLESLGLSLDRRLREDELARYWGNRLLTVFKQQPERLETFVKDFKKLCPEFSLHFKQELIAHLFDEDAVMSLIKKYMDDQDEITFAESLQQLQKLEANDEVAFSSAIISLITLGQLSWADIFETVSKVDEVLRNDPVKAYQNMNFTTKDSYRKAVEMLARRAKVTEIETAALTLELAENNKGHSPASSHVGYYLIDDGRLQLESLLKCSLNFINGFRRFLNKHSTAVYLTSIVVVTTLIEMILYGTSISFGGSTRETFILLALSLIPASEIAIQFIHFLIPFLLPPNTLPKMNFEKGIPEENKTLVVIPSLLLSDQSLNDNIQQLEIHYLANSDPALRFGLVLDFADRETKTHPEDDVLLEKAITKLKALSDKYGEDIFFLFARKPIFSESESAWIGWERKRGKLEILNRFLMCETKAQDFLKFGKPENLKNTKYVITLDADTILPKGKAVHLVETIAHPLNAVELTNEKRIKRGYTIIQPRVSTDFSEKHETLFYKLFSDSIGVDPYTSAVSDVYQDLMHEGSYHGKCIYDVSAFHEILTGKFPDDHILSHDLLEGSYVRTAFASDILLYDQFPQNYFSWCKRLHRWIRGDFQISDWLFSKVPSSNKNQEPNPLSFINKWKIFDNLRRALIMPSMLLLLISTWFLSTTTHLWTLFAVIALYMPSFFQLFTNMAAYFRAQIPFIKQVSLAFIRPTIFTALLPHLSKLTLDAFCRVFYRKHISKKKLLEWSQGTHPKEIRSEKAFFQVLIVIACLSIALFLAVAYINPSAIIVAIPFCFLWTVSPLIVKALDSKTLIKKDDLKIPKEDQLFLRKIARKTWRYFDDFVNVHYNFLPPDNYQDALLVEVAPRTSPTNIGLWMVSLISAYDLKYVSADKVIERMRLTVDTLSKLELYEGHFLNWYDIVSLKPLFPRYVSTVDSGNFLACLWTINQTFYEMIEKPILPLNFTDGLNDTLEIFFETTNNTLLSLNLIAFRNLIKNAPKNYLEAIITLKTALKLIQDELLAQDKKTSEELYWLKKIEEMLLDWKNSSDRYLEWMDILTESPFSELLLKDASFETKIKMLLKEKPSLKNISNGKQFDEFIKSIESLKNNADDSLKKSIENLNEAFNKSKWLSGEILGEIKVLIVDIDQISKMTNMSFLYNEERKLFSIGYHVDDRKLDNSFYDLLASEARLASLVSIAKNDIPLDHWWLLGRPYRIIDSMKVLVSWGGTMFEYLMPLLFTKQTPESLLGNACKMAVTCQINYATKRGIPWGISESAFSEIDNRKTYQYRSFGIPELGLKRDLDKDLVVSPYSSLLALAVNPKAAIENLKRLSRGNQNLFGNYGFYESIDFTRQHDVHGVRGIIIYAFMVHHQGMSLISINNVLNRNIIIKRFSEDPRIKGVESLLYEQIPANPPVTKAYRKEVPISRLSAFPKTAIMGVLDTPHTTAPRVNLLSNEDYSVMLTNSGGGYSKWRNIDITRWRSDTTLDPWGSFCYIKDLETNKFWSTTFHPTYNKGQKFSVRFKSDKVEYRRKDNDIETITEITVSPQDNSEIRLVTLLNLSKSERRIELTSYSELSLAPHKTDLSHPAFNKLFIETENIPELNGLIAFRRLRSSDDQPIFASHTVVSDQQSTENFQFETDRQLFIGRGNTLGAPDALKGPLKNSSGFVLDPIFALRKTVTLNPGARVQIAFITSIAETKEKVLELIKKYQDIQQLKLTFEMAWTSSQLQLRHLRIHQEEAQLFQKLAGYVLYPQAGLRLSSARLSKNRLGQSSLWAYGISGDLPIVVVSVADSQEVDLVKQMLTAHAFWRQRGLKTDLVIFNDEITGYEHPLFEHLNRIVHSQMHGVEIGKSGGIYLLNSDQMPEEDVQLIFSLSRANLVAARGFLRQHLVSQVDPQHLTPRLLINKNKPREEHHIPLKFLELPYFNGLGGFSADGKEYVIYLGPDVNTPAPWINVIANPLFGTIVTETGLGCAWYGNSQTNRITPWSNDALLNPIKDALYIRDDHTGAFWTVTASPIREKEAYRARHGQGYSYFEHNSHEIEQELLVFVPMDEEETLPIRIQRLELTNKSNVKRELTLFSYSELVLGTDKEETEMHLVSSWDLESQSLFANNYYNSNYKDMLVFTSSSSDIQSFSGNRAEFLGRNHHLGYPTAIKRKALSNKTGAGMDPCFAFDVKIELEPGEKKQLVFVLGVAESTDSARKIIANTKNLQWVEELFQKTKDYWNKRLETVQIESPDLFINFAVNRWLLYQNLSCRIWGRTAFYQSSGAFGFRDQLQDVMAMLYADPKIAREQILTTAKQQFVEGDVQHWWLPPSNAGVRTRISDDLLWLPFVTAQYCRVTNDFSILAEVIPFIQGDLLKDDQHEIFFQPEISKEKATLLDHCKLAVHKGFTKGPHELPLIGGGDWNDGMNLVGIEGKGESIWLGWFLIHVLHDLSFLLENSGEAQAAKGYIAQSKRLAESIEKSGWDGEWYLRAYMDDGTPLGSKTNDEDKIDCLPQSWAVISGMADKTRQVMAMNAVEKHLILQNEKLVLLLTPPFDKTALNPGYIKGYPPGVRENGGQYTHGSLWVPLAFARMGDGTKAAEILKMMHPVMHTSQMEGVHLYQKEPYVTAGDVYALDGKIGQGGWSWYTGSAAWMYRIWLEEIFGFHLRGDVLKLKPAIPENWGSAKIKYRHKSAFYEIVFENPLQIKSERVEVELDGVRIDGDEIALKDDGKEHHVLVKIVEG